MASGFPASGLIQVLTAVSLVGLGCSDGSAPANRPPTVTISSPIEGSSHPGGVSLVLKGSATDPEDGSLTGTALTWSSAADGDLGTGDSLQVSSLTAGQQTVTLSARDSHDAAGTATVHFTVTPDTGTNHPPAVSITTPPPGSSFVEGAAVILKGVAVDPEEGSLLGTSLAWSSSRDGALGTGDSLSVTTLSLGSHTITLTATDGGGASAQATRTLTITAAAPNPVLDTFVTGLDFPVFLTQPAGDSRIFVVEKPGRIRIIKNGVLQTTPFLDIGDSLSHDDTEQGLLGLAFYPDFGTSGRFIVDYTSPNGGPSTGPSAGSERLVRYHLSGNPDLADPASAELLLSVPDPYTNHNGGMVVFGPDGYLYYGIGDGGNGGDPQGHGQDRTDLLGSLMRLDVSGSGAYSIPASNPYATSSTLKGELWNYGLRNPWRFSFDRQTHDLYIADVGQSNVEEVDVAPASSTGGENYGWNIMEGNQCYPPGVSSCNQAGLTLPVVTYTHSDGCSITGGYVYRGAALPALQGQYFYSDYCSHFIRSFHWENGQVSAETEWPTLDPGDNVTSFGEDASGELYLITQGGVIYRIAPGSSARRQGGRMLRRRDGRILRRQDGK
jgi:glucose/arabinose dehydrogenase